MHRIAHIQDGVVVNVSVASSEWLDENQSDTILECPEDVGTGCLYDPDLDEFLPPVPEASPTTP